jgi:hypothetical protein
MMVSKWTVPGLIIFLTIFGITSSRIISIPSLTVEFGQVSPNQETRESVFLVDGVKCVDTARLAMSALKGLDGVFSAVAYASRNRIEVRYDPGLIDKFKISDAFESPIYDSENKEYLFRIFSVLEIDGSKLSR